ncbi:ABC transporter ATP-binding protein/permease [Gordonia crocea]|uniref:Putative ABC transporter, ATP-binding protein n=1 Tax=Gordonia crocea TaxID=589162 RepID=A0A7I9UX70_9ACTN|nr:ABC transporter ATP-binding protein/permease [Gordonia crocea]GED97675.1 putative ABC transporter, ATP-binding protein [Gordonia crocea]
MNTDGGGLDWGDELVNSLVWTLWVSAASLAGLVVVGALLAAYTKWGRQYWRVTGGFFTDRQIAPMTWLLIVVLLLLAIFGVRLNVLFTYQGLDMYNAIQAGASALGKEAGDPARQTGLDAAQSAFWKSMAVFALLATIHVVRTLVEVWFGAAFSVRMRSWLTEHVTEDWLADRAFYRNRFVPIETTDGDLTAGVDNPDQRIEADITTLVTWTRQFVFSSGGSATGGIIPAIVTMVTFSVMLWGLSGPMHVFGLEISHGLVYLLLMFVFLASLVAFWIGRPLIHLNFLKERLTANFRFALVRVRENAENIALYSGEEVEHRGLIDRFDQVIKNYWNIIHRTLLFSGWNLSVSQTSVVLPFLVQANRFFAGSISFGQLNQTASAFGNLSDALSFFRLMYDDFTAFRASIIRLDGLQDADAKARKLPTIDTADGDDIELRSVDINKPDGTLLIEDLSLRLVTGEALVVKGRSGSGKTTLFRGLSGLWPYAEGEFVRPAGQDTLFLSQVPYLPLADLRSVLTYPAPPTEFSDDELRQVLIDVSLPHLVERLDEDEYWAKVLSPGEQQRVGFARILLSRPKVVFLDEATSAVDEGLEYALYNLIRTRLPETIVVSISHRSTTEQHHTKMLELQGEGRWELTDIAVETA